MNDRQNVDVSGLDLIEDAIGIQRKLPDILLAEFRHLAHQAGQLIEQEGLAHQGIRYALGVERRILGDVIVNMAKLDQGVAGSLHHD